MAVASVSRRALGCGNCHQWALRSFMSSVSELYGLPPMPTRRAFGTSPRKTFDRSSRLAQDASEKTFNLLHESKTAQELKDTNEDNGILDLPDAPTSARNGGDAKSVNPFAEPPQAAEVAHIPWYLQQQPNAPTLKSPMAARQRIPDLPDYPPALLHSLLRHVTVELGMDSLSLLDLRQLDPPPALGSNLIMIIGTARSEKHLHVSADRLCRWLRTDYKMTPYADGLLGRNELKLKMKRKAKRTRLMSAVGAKSTGEGELDDGLRTGWVCVNVGRVEDGELPEIMGKVQRAEGYVGFGAETTGCNIVVQLMTEEKRGEVDLEKLWGGIMNRARRDAGKEGDEATSASDEAGSPSLSTSSSGD
ncbi:ATPase synthesis protein 25 mitochondrial, partial [Oleoguttula sp. CCFEE 5521]